MDIHKIEDCVLSVNGTDYNAKSFIRKWVDDGVNVAIALSDEIVFMDDKGDTTVCRNSTCYYDQVFVDKKVIISNMCDVIITDITGVPLEFYMCHSTHTQDHRIHPFVTKKYVLAIRHDMACGTCTSSTMNIFVREDTSKYIETLKMFIHPNSIDRDERKWYQNYFVYTLNEIKHAVGPDLILTDGYDGFRDNVIINGNILVYTNSKGDKISVELPTEPKIKREPDKNKKRERQEIKLYELKRTRNKLKDKIENCSSRYKTLHHEEKLKNVIQKIEKLEDKISV